CNAIYHFQNIDKYAENIDKLELKKLSGTERLKTVKRGFFLAIFFCLFLVTIPLTIPFAMNLLSRKQQIEKQIANIEDAIKKEKKRLEAAEEGAVVSEEIQELVGAVSLEETRFILTEILNISQEFDETKCAQTDTKILLVFLKENLHTLEQLFKKSPENTYETFQWFTKNVIIMRENEILISQLKTNREEIMKEQKGITKGHPIGVLNKSLTHLDNLAYETLKLDLNSEMKMYFCEICKDIDVILNRAREGLFLVSRGLPVDEKYWQETHSLLRSVLNIISLCLMASDLEASSPDLLHLNPTSAFLKEQTNA
ncbi:MAG: hypothetical protein K2X39_06660, partial [Silvanigrellaceae bacterium]|nr:hypothetical protein [Silvanigrellaceae bacterium]